MRRVVIISVGIVGVIAAIAAFFLLPDPQSLGVASTGVLVALGCLFLLKAGAEPAVGTNDAPPDPYKDVPGGHI